MEKCVLEQVWKFLETIKPGQLQYVKTLEGNMREGVFDNIEDFVRECSVLPDISMYTIPNKIKAECFLEEKRNKLDQCQKGEGIVKNDIESRDYWFLDFDIVHESGVEVSATEEEHKLAMDLAKEVEQYLSKEFKLPSPIIADSGNGCYLLYKTDSIEVNLESDELFRDITRAVANNFNSDKVIIDVKVHDRGRLIKAIGSKAVKGVETEDRKHRYSKTEAVPEQMLPITKQKLQGIVEWGAKFKRKPTTTKQSSNNSVEKEKKPVADKIAETIEREAVFFLDQNEETWATCNLPSGKVQSYSLEGSGFKRWVLRTLCNELQMKAVQKDHYNQALSYWGMLAYESDKVIKIQNRIAVNETMTEIYYDCNSADDKAILMTAGEVSIIDTPIEMFRRERADCEQVLPNINADCKNLMKYVDKFFNCATQVDLTLLTIYIVTCFLGADINHAIMIFSGSKGSAKSTATRYIQQLVSPQRTGITTMSKKLDDVAVRLSHSILAVFDNLSQISDNISDLLCVGVTGGTYPKRKLFTDNEEIYLQLKAMIIMNGVNVVAEKSDLLDRSVNIELKRLTKENMKSPTELDAMFQADLPDMLGSIMKAVAIALADEELVETDELIRMADFHIWGIKIARALGIEQKEFEDALLSNRRRINEKAIDNYPVAALLLDFLEGKPSWIGAVSKLHSELTKLAFNKNISTHQAKFPKDAGALSRRLKEVESNLAEVGIRFSIRNIGNCKEIEVINSNVSSDKKIFNQPSNKTKELLFGKDDEDEEK